MRAKTAHFHLRIHPSFLAYLALIVSLSSIERGICALAALLIHEAGHLLAAVLVGQPVSSLEFTPFGGVLAAPSGKVWYKGSRGAIIAIAGPLANYLCIQIIALPQLLSLIKASWASNLITANLAMLTLNLLPAFPLDGGQLLFCIGYYLFPVCALLKILTIAGCVLSAVLISFALYGLAVYKTLNCSLLIISGFIFFYAKKSRHAQLAENIYVLLEESRLRKKSVREIRLIAVTKESRLLPLLSYADNPHEVIFLSDEALPLREGIDMDRIGRLLLRFGDMPFVQATELINSGFFTE